MTKYNRLIAATIVLSLVLTACSAIAGSGSDDQSLLSRSTVVERGSLRVTVSGTGEIEPAAEASLSFKVDGTVGAIPVSVGDQVVEGDLLMELDPGSLDVNLASAESELIQAEQQLEEVQDLNNWRIELAQARKELALAEDALEDAEYLHRVRQQGNRASQSTIDVAEARLVLAENSVDRAKAEYDKYSGRASDDPARALALQKLAGAREDRDAAERALNWYTGKPTEIEQAQLDADVAVAEANLNKARERVQILEDGPDPDKVKAGQARLDAARARVNQARLVAPFEGTVVAINYSTGDSVTPGQPAVALAILSQLHVETSIDELDIATLELGQPATVTLDALPQLQLEGMVQNIDLIPQLGTSATEYPIRVDLTSFDERARVGMTVTVNVLVADEQNVLVIPNWSLRFDSTTGEVYVNVLRGDQIERQDIELGLRNESFSQVTSGLEEGDTIGIVGSVEEEGGSFPGPFGG